jgi:NADH dehydrogenase
MQGLVTVFGGSGFIGKQVVRALAKRGLRVRVAVRRPNVAYEMPLMGDVGQVELVQANLRNPASIARALEGAEACVNLVGALYESANQTFDALHAEGAELVAQACAQRGITRLVQMSALGADAGSTSKYARTKAEGEAAARRHIPSAVIVRPSIVFGQEDAFFNRFAAMATLSPVLPLPGGGKTLYQPVFVGDVGKAIAECVVDPACAGRIFELGGPQVLSFKGLMELMLRVIQRKRFLAPLPFPIAKVMGFFGDVQVKLLPIAPPLTRDQVELLKSDNVCSGEHPGLGDLGIEPAAIEAIIPTYLFRYRPGGQFAEAAPHITPVPVADSAT